MEIKKMFEKVKSSKKLTVIAIIVIVLIIIIIAGVSNGGKREKEIKKFTEFMQKGEYEPAKVILDEQMKKDGTNKEVNLLLADYYITTGDYLNALSTTEKAIERVRNNEEIIAKKAEIETKYATQIENAKKQIEETEKQKVEAEKLKAEEDKKQKEQEKENKKEQSEQDRKDFKKSCVAISYKDLARNPNSYLGKAIKVTGQVSQILEGGVFKQAGLRVYEDYDLTSSDTFLKKEWFFNYDQSNYETKLLKEDIITAYGTFDGTVEMERALTGTTDNVPVLTVKYCELLK